MKIKVEVTTQKEYDVVIATGNMAVCVSGKFVLRENASAELWGNASAELRGNASAELWGNASAVLRENASAELRENASAVLRENASAELWENASAELRENASAELWGNASAEASGNVFLRVFSALKIVASASVIILMHGKSESITGGQRIQAKQIKTVKDWCELYGVPIVGGVVILYKGVNDQFTTDKGCYYTPGTIPTAPDWDGGKEECGGGLHFSPCPQMTLEFYIHATKFVGCPISIKDIVVHPNGTYPQKVKAKGCCGPVFEVDRKGNKKVTP